MLLGINHYNLCADRATLEILKDFYCRVVGLTIGPRPLTNFGYWLYIGEKDILHLSESKLDEKRLSQISGTFHHIAFTAEHYDDVIAHLNAQQISYKTREVTNIGIRQIFFSDPCGNGVEFNFQS